MERRTSSVHVRTCRYSRRRIFLGFFWCNTNTYYLFLCHVSDRGLQRRLHLVRIHQISLLVKKTTSHHELCMCVCVCCTCMCQVCVCVCVCVCVSSPSSGVCQWLTVKAEGRELRQYRVMRDVVNRLGHASVTAAAQLTWHVSSTPRRFVYASPVKPGEEAEVETGAH